MWLIFIWNQKISTISLSFLTLKNNVSGRNSRLYTISVRINRCMTPWKSFLCFPFCKEQGSKNSEKVPLGRKIIFSKRASVLLTQFNNSIAKRFNLTSRMRFRWKKHLRRFKELKLTFRTERHREKAKTKLAK